MTKANKCDAENCFGGTGARCPRVRCELCSFNSHVKCANLGNAVAKLMRDSPGVCWLCSKCRNTDTRESPTKINSTLDLVLQRTTSTLKLVGALIDSMQLHRQLDVFNRPSCCSLPRPTPANDIDYFPGEAAADFSNIFNSIMGDKRQRTSSISRPSLSQPEKIMRVDVPIPPATTTDSTFSSVLDAADGQNVSPSITIMSCDEPSAAHTHVVATPSCVAAQPAPLLSEANATPAPTSPSLSNNLAATTETLPTPAIISTVADRTNSATSNDYTTAAVVQFSDTGSAVQTATTNPAAIRSSFVTAGHSSATTSGIAATTGHAAAASSAPHTDYATAVNPAAASLASTIATCPNTAALRSTRSAGSATAATFGCAAAADQAVITGAAAAVRYSDILAATTSTRHITANVPTFIHAATPQNRELLVPNSNELRAYTTNLHCQTAHTSVTSHYAEPGLGTQPPTNTIPSLSVAPQTLTVTPTSLPQKWFYVTRFMPHETADNLIRYIHLKTNCNPGSIQCSKLVGNNRNTNRPLSFISFKVCVPESIEDSITTVGFWPTGVSIQPFLEKRQPTEPTGLSFPYRSVVARGFTRPTTPRRRITEPLPMTSSQLTYALPTNGSQPPPSTRLPRQTIRPSAGNLTTSYPYPSMHKWLSTMV